MREVYVQGGPIPLGRQGENQAQAVIWQGIAAEYAALYGEGAFQLMVARCGDAAPYPVALTRDGGSLVWTVSDSDTAKSGVGRCELTYLVGGVVAKSKTWQTQVLASFTADGSAEPPDPAKSWVQEVLDAATAAGKSAEAAADSADKAEDASVHAPQIGADGAWETWDQATGAYVSTGVEAQGPKGEDAPIVQSDWAQNDETAADYVKGRPGGYDAPISWETSQVMGGAGEQTFFPVNVPAEFIVLGQRFTVTVDGESTTYVAAAASDDGKMFQFGTFTREDLEKNPPENGYIFAVSTEELTSGCNFGGVALGTYANKPFTLSVDAIFVASGLFVDGAGDDFTVPTSMISAGQLFTVTVDGESTTYVAEAIAGTPGYICFGPISFSEYSSGNMPENGYMFIAAPDDDSGMDVCMAVGSYVGKSWELTVQTAAARIPVKYLDMNAIQVVMEGLLFGALDSIRTDFNSQISSVEDQIKDLETDNRRLQNELNGLSAAIGKLIGDQTLKDEYLRFASANPFSLETSSDPKWDGIVEFCTKETADEWNTWDGSKIQAGAATEGYILYLRGFGNTRMEGVTSEERGFFQLTGTEVSCDGNIETLLNYVEVYAGKHPAMDQNAFSRLFQGCDCLISAPRLPAPKLTYGCYEYMFSGCTSLRAAPALPAADIYPLCYYNMFARCTALASIPALPATRLWGDCYESMFEFCSAVKISETQNDVYKTPYRIPSNGDGTQDDSGTLAPYMFYRTGGTFTDHPAINTTYYTANEVVGGDA